MATAIELRPSATMIALSSPLRRATLAGGRSVGGDTPPDVVDARRSATAESLGGGALARSRATRPDGESCT